MVSIFGTKNEPHQGHSVSIYNKGEVKKEDKPFRQSEGEEGETTNNMEVTLDRKLRWSRLVEKEKKERKITKSLMV